ncbi:MAG: hypothetical protein LBU85_06185 [Treponema sp.]|jgi:hypothetical protein|nr:hypothetical protein [Treponema sp.]
MKKGFLLFILLLLVTVSGFSQAQAFLGIGLMGNYNPFNPSYWGIGTMINGSISKDGVFFHVIRFGMSYFGDAIQTYERENIYNSKKELTEYWQKGKYYEFFFGGYAFQMCFAKFFALRLGADVYFSYSPAYSPPQTSYYFGASSDSLSGFNFGFTGVAGLVLFPKGKYFISVDACPGFQNNEFHGKFNIGKDYDPVSSFVMPIRLTVGVNFGG